MANSKYDTNAIISGTMLCNSATIYNPIKTGYATLPTFNTNSIGYSVSNSLSGNANTSVTMNAQTHYVIPGSGGSLLSPGVTNEPNNWCTLNAGVYIFSCDFQIIKFRESMVFALELNGVVIYYQGTNKQIGIFSDDTAITFLCTAMIPVKDNGSSLRCSISPASDSSPNTNIIDRFNISVVKIA